MWLLKKAPTKEELAALKTVVAEPKTLPLSRVMTKEQQQNLTPDAVLKDFIDGNSGF